MTHELKKLLDEMSARAFNSDDAVKAWKIESSKAILHQQDSSCFHREFVSGARWQFEQDKAERDRMLAVIRKLIEQRDRYISISSDTYEIV